MGERIISDKLQATRNRGSLVAVHFYLKTIGLFIGATTLIFVGYAGLDAVLPDNLRLLRVFVLACYFAGCIALTVRAFAHINKAPSNPQWRGISANADANADTSANTSADMREANGPERQRDNPFRHRTTDRAAPSRWRRHN